MKTWKIEFHNNTYNLHKIENGRKSKASLSYKDEINKITKDPECLYELRRYYRKSEISIESFFKDL